MSFFNKMLASIGIGSATVDTRLEKSTYTAGETLRGTIDIAGGSTEQYIDAIYLTLYTTYIKEVNDNKYTDSAAIHKVKVNEPFTLGANERKSIPFTFQLPFDTPATLGKTRVWIHTGLDIKNAVDPTDKDFIEVNPSPLAAQVLQTIERIGFRLRKVDCEYASMKLRSPYVFVQEFEFTPTIGTYRSQLDELEVIFLSQTVNSAQLLLQVDRRARGLGGLFAEAMDMDESFVRLTITTEDIPYLNQKLQQTINKYI